MRFQSAVLVLMLLSASHQHEVVKRESGGEKRVVCYYTNWSVYRPGTAKFNPQNINPYLCTHLIYAFGGLDRENGLRPYDKYQDIEQGGYAKFTGLKTYNKALKTMLAIGGWNEGSARFSPLVADDERRREFVKNVVKFLRINHFDGLDLDWEYPAYRDGGKPKDKENYAQLVQELREEFERESDKTGRPRLLLTMAVPAGIEYIDKGYDIPRLNKYLDFMNILSYDYHSAFEPSVNHHSPLYSIEEENEYNFDSQLTIDATVKHYILKGADPEKLVLGIPTYGRSYTLFNPDSTDLGAPSDGPGEQGDATREKGYLAYYEICENVNKEGWTVIQPKESALGPYAFKGNQWVGYDDESIVKRKSHYVNEKNLGGIMFWSIDNDDFRGKCHSRPYPLIEAAKEALIGKAAGVNQNKLPSAPRGGKGTSSKVSSKLKNHRIPATSSTTQATVTLSTPDPPTTPDPGSDFVCKDEGFFPHPRDCKKYFWCLDSGPSNLGIVAHQFTCPSGLFFNKAADSCDFARNVPCKKKSSDSTTTTTTSSPTKSTSSTKTLATTRTTTTTTTTTEAPVEEEEEYYEEQEDPQTIKQLISLIKKLGGVAELEKQLEGSSSGTDSTTPAISKSLYERVISKQTTRYQSAQRNGPTGPQNEGIPRESGRSSSNRKEKPAYVTIRRERPTTEKTASVEYEDEEAADIPNERPKYTPIQRNRGSQTERTEQDKPTERNKLRYQTVERFRPKLRENSRNPPEETEEEEEEATSERRQQSSTLRYTNILRSRSSTPDTSTSTTSRYVTLQRQRPQPPESEDLGTTENELIGDEEMTEERLVDTTTTTLRPRVKVSDVLTTTPTVLTSTRVVTQVVEGATKRQRVPLHMLQQLLKDSENFVDSFTKPYGKEVTTEAVTVTPRVSGFRTRRPIVITTTVRTTPAYIALRRNRLKTTTTTEATETSTKQKGFVPSRTRGRITTESNDFPEDAESEAPSQTKPEDSEKDEKPTRGYSSRRSTTTESTQNSRFRNRFSARRSTTTTERPTDDEEKLLTREYSRDTNVIRRPLVKPRFPSRRLPTTAATESSKEAQNTTENATSRSTLELNNTSEESSTITSPSTKRNTSEIIKDNTEVPAMTDITTPIVSVADNQTKNVSDTTANPNGIEVSHTTFTSGETIPFVEVTTNLADTTPHHRFNRPKNNAVQIISTNETLSDSQTGNSDQVVRNKTKIILRRKKPIDESSDANGLESSTHRPLAREKVIIRKRPQPTPKSLDIADEDYGYLENSVSSTFSPTKARGRTRFATSIKDEIEEDQTPATSHFRSKTATEERLSTRPRSTNTIATTRARSRTASDRGTTVSAKESAVTTRSRSRVVSDRGTTVATFNKDIDSTETRYRHGGPTTRRYQEISRSTEYNPAVSDSREARSRSRVADTDSRKRLISVESITEQPQYQQNRQRQRVRTNIQAVDASSSTPQKTQVLQRGQKKFKLEELVSVEDLEAANVDLPQKQSSQSINLVKTNNNVSTNSQKKKIRTVVLRKAVKDLAVGESGIPDQETYNNSIDEDPAGGSLKIYDSLINDDLVIDFIQDTAQNGSQDTTGEEEIIQSRARNPFNRRTSTRSTTTTSTENPTTTRQRTTAQILRQRLSRFRNERGQAQRGTTSTESLRTEEDSTTIRPRKPGFRRVIRPSSVQNLEESTHLDSSIEQSVAKDTVTKTKQFHRETSFRPQAYLRQTTQTIPRTDYSAEPSDYKGSDEGSPDVVTVEEHTSLDSDEGIPDLANVAVAAIQSLATSAPTNPTEQYVTTTIRPTYREIIQTTQRPRPRQTRPHTPPPNTTPAIVPVRSVARSSPRPFSKVLPGVIPPNHRPLNPLRPANAPLYDDYDDLYAEPIEIPLSGKVRIHNDGYIECLDIGNFPHPFSCRKFISCAKMENGHLLGWEYTCPKGLSFDPIGGICNWNAGLGCKE